MAKTNVSVRVVGGWPSLDTHEGGKSPRLSAEQQLKRLVMSCMLWEDSFYEDGQDIATRLCDLVRQVSPDRVVEIAREARQVAGIRHASLLVARELLRHPAANNKQKRDAIHSVIQRADEPAEFLSLYWKDGRKMIPKAARLGLSDALNEFDSYELSKYNRDASVRLRDVIRMVHPVPKNEAQSLLFKSILDGTLASADTWEVALSGGEDKRSVFTRLLSGNKLGYLALLRNLRNMEQAGVDHDLIFAALAKGSDRAWPFHFMSAAKHAPWALQALETGLLASTLRQEKLKGHTLILVDFSGSMQGTVSSKSQVTRQDAAAGLAVMANELSYGSAVYAFSTVAGKATPYRGLALIDSLNRTGIGGGTDIGASLKQATSAERKKFDRVIVITDEQSSSYVSAPSYYGCERGYIVNVASYQNGIGYGDWVRVNGFSEQTINFIREYEKSYG